MSPLTQFEILLVEDLRSDALVFETALKETSSRARVYWVPTGEEAIEFLYQRGRFAGAGPVQVVVLDLHLGREDGFSVLRAIKSDPDLNRQPVVILSSSGSQAEIDLAYSLGANAYFKKPMSLEAFVELIRILTVYWLDLAELPSLGRSFRPDAVPASDRELRYHSPGID